MEDDDRQMRVSPVASFLDISVGKTTTTFTIDDPTMEDDAFWQSTSMSEANQSQHEEEEELLTDEADSVEELARFSKEEFRFYHENALKAGELEETGPQELPLIGNGTQEFDKDVKYLSFCPEDSDADTIGDDNTLVEDGIVVLPDIDNEEETSFSSAHTFSTNSDSTLPTSAPPESPVRTCKAPQSHRKKTTISFTGGNTNSSRTNSSVTTTATVSSDSSIDKSPRRKNKGRTTITITGLKGQTESSPSSRTSSSRTRSDRTRSSCDKSGRSGQTRSSCDKSGRSGQTRSTNNTKSTHNTKSTKNSSGRRRKPPRPPRQDSEAKQKNKQLTRRMPRRLDSSCMQSVAEESLQATIATRWQRHCESLWAPIFLDMWDNYDAKDGDDDGTLATFEEEASYEDEGNVNVLVAVQATVLGTDFPDVLNAPKDSMMPHVWGSNFVGVVQSPKGDTVHSRKFPPGCRAASVAAWSAASHKPYIVCNSSNLLQVPPLDGLHLDGTEVSVLVAAYLPAFQALHHGQRQHRQLAYDATALEGQRILILSHSNVGSSKPSSLNQSLVDARVQAAVRMALWAGATDVHVTVPKAGNTKRNIFGNDYRVRLLDTPPDDWIPILKSRMNLVLDYTGGFSFGKHSTSNIVEKVMAKKIGRYVGCLGEDCSSPALDCREEAPINKKKQSTWSESLSMFQGKDGCGSSGILPEGKDIRHVIEWTALCMKMPRASLFDFYGSWKHDRRLAEHDFKFLLELLAKRQIRPHVAKILDVGDFPSLASHQLRSTRSMSGAVVCEPWCQFKGTDDLSCSSSLS